jgi:hypothetical protein
MCDIITCKRTENWLGHCFPSGGKRHLLAPRSSEPSRGNKKAYNASCKHAENAEKPCNAKSINGRSNETTQLNGHTQRSNSGRGALRASTGNQAVQGKCGQRADNLARTRKLRRRLCRHKYSGGIPASSLDIPVRATPGTPILSGFAHGSIDLPARARTHAHQAGAAWQLSGKGVGSARTIQRDRDGILRNPETAGVAKALAR